MKLIKMFGLAAIIACASTALLGVSSASATNNTQLCKVHTATTCPAGSATTAVHIVNKPGTVGFLLSDLVDVLCLNVLGQGTPLALGKPQQIHSTVLSFTQCGSNASHNNCTVTTETQPLFELLNIGLDVGILTATSGVTRVQCTVFGFIKIDCKYAAAGLEFEVEGGNPGEFSAEETPVSFIAGSALCPEESTLDGELQSLEEVHILQ